MYAPSALSARTGATDPCQPDGATLYLRRNDVRAALHVDPLAAPFSPCALRRCFAPASEVPRMHGADAPILPSFRARVTACIAGSDAINDAYSCADTLVDVEPLYRELLARSGARLLVYSGDVDGIVPTLATRRWIAQLVREHAPAPADADGEWRHWQASGQLAGYQQRWGWANNASLLFATVRGAGHQVPMYQPERALAMARRFIYHNSLL